MNRISRRSLLGAAVLSTALAGTAGSAAAATLHVHGAVVHRNARAHSFVVADRAGHLYAVHGRAPRIGHTVTVTATSLRNGTFALRHDTIGRLQRQVRVRGVVTYANRRKGIFTVSAAGVSMLVRHAARAGDVTPTVGTEVVATGNVDDQGDLNEQNVETVGQDTGAVELEGTILSVDAAAGTITVSADDEDQSGQAIVVTVPSSFDISRFTPGEEAELTVDPTGATTATLAGSADDENAQSADDASAEQGDVGDDEGDRSGDTSSATTGSSAAGSGSSSDERSSSVSGSERSGSLEG